MYGNVYLLGYPLRVHTYIHIRCDKCGGLLRPHVVWFGEALESEVLQKTDQALAKCDLCLLVSGTAKTAYICCVVEFCGYFYKQE